MSVQMTDPQSVTDDSPQFDVFLARRQQILSTLAPSTRDVTTGSERPPTLPLEPSPADEPIDEDGPETEFDSSAGYFQFPSDEDLEDGLDDDDENQHEDDHPPAPRQLTRSGHLIQRARHLNWKSPRVLISAAALLLAVMVLVIVFKPRPNSTPPLVINAAPETTPPAVAPPKPVDAPLKIDKAEARCPRGGADANNAFDGHMETAWRCQMPYGPGQRLVIHLGNTSVVSKLTIVPGFQKFSADGDEWTKYHTVTKVRWLFGPYDQTKPCNLDNNCLDTNTENARQPVPVPVQPNKTTDTITMLVLQTTPPPSAGGILSGDSTSQADTFAVSEIQVIGHVAS